MIVTWFDYNLFLTDFINQSYARYLNWWLVDLFFKPTYLVGSYFILTKKKYTKINFFSIQIETNLDIYHIQSIAIHIHDQISYLLLLLQQDNIFMIFGYPTIPLSFEMSKTPIIHDHHHHVILSEHHTIQYKGLQITTIKEKMYRYNPKGEPYRASMHKSAKKTPVSVVCKTSSHFSYSTWQKVHSP